MLGVRRYEAKEGARRGVREVDGNMNPSKSQRVLVVCSVVVLSCSRGRSWSGCRGHKVVGLAVGWVERPVMQAANGAVAVVVERNSSRSPSFSVHHR